ncbi:MAG: glycosyltransferase family 39 protein [Burkholderiales bacterium]
MTSAQGMPVARWTAWGLLALIVVLTGYRFWLVAHSGITLFVDEAQYWDWARELAWGYYSKPPVIAWLIAASIQVLGDGLLGVKAAGMLLYPLTTLAVWGCGRAMFGPRAGAIAALAFVTAPLTGLLGLFVSTDAPLLLCWAVATWAGWLALGPAPMVDADEPGDAAQHWGAWVVLGAALGLGVLSKYTMVAIVPGLLWALWAWGPRGAGWAAWRARLAGALLASLIAIGWVLPHLLWNLNNGAPTLRHTMEITATAHRAGGLPALAEFLASQTLLLGPVATLALVLAAWRGWRRRRAVAGPAEPLALARSSAAEALSARSVAVRNVGVQRDELRYLLVLALPLLGLAIAQSINAHAHMNWAAPAYLSAVLLLGRVLQGRPRWLLATVLFNLLAVALVTHAADLARLASRPLPSQWDALVRMRGHDRAFADLRPVMQAHAAWPVVSGDRQLLSQAAYQWRDLGVRPRAWNPEHRADNHYQLSTELESLRGRDVLFLSEEPLPPPVLARFGSVLEVLQSRVEVAPRRIVTVRLYVLHDFQGYR